MEAEYRLNEREYRLGKLPVMEQIRLAKKVLPAVSGLLLAMAADDDTNTDPVAAFKPMIDAIVGLPEKELTDLIVQALKPVRRIEGGKAQLVWNPNANQPQYDDITMVEVLDLTMASLKYNFGPFIEDVARRTKELPKPEQAALPTF